MKYKRYKKIKIQGLQILFIEIFDNIKHFGF